MSACAFLDQVTVDTLRAFVAWQRKSYDQNTLYCRFSELLAFLLKNGIEVHLSSTRTKHQSLLRDQSKTWRSVSFDTNEPILLSEKGAPSSFINRVPGSAPCIRRADSALDILRAVESDAGEE